MDDRERGGLDVTLLLINGGHEAVDFTLPEPALQWRLAVDTAEPDADSYVSVDGPISVQGRSVVLLSGSPLDATFEAPSDQQDDAQGDASNGEPVDQPAE